MPHRSPRSRIKLAFLACLLKVLTFNNQTELAVGFGIRFPNTNVVRPSRFHRHLRTKSDAHYETADANAIIDVSILSQLDSCPTRSAAHKILTRALANPPDETKKTLYNSISIPPNLSTRSISDAELALQTRTIQSKYKIYQLIEQNGDRDVDRASLAVLCTFLAGATTAILLQQTNEVSLFGTTWYIPDIIRFVLVWAFSFSPLVLVGYGLALPEQLSTSLIAIQRNVFPSYRKRMIQHEAGHFLVGHLLGWPVKSYRAGNAVKNAVEFYPLSDEDVGRNRAEALGFNIKKRQVEEDTSVPQENDYADRPFYSKEGKGSSLVDRSVFRDESVADYSLPPKDDPKSSWPFRGFDDETLDKLAVISVAGACAEILAYGNAEGGVADLIQLRRIYGAAASASTRTTGDENALGTFSDDATERRLRRGDQIQTKVQTKGRGVMDEKEMDNRTKFALGFAMVLLRSNLGALDALADIMERDGTVADCIVAVENCPNVSGVTLKGDYDKIRRERFRAEEGGVGSWVERTFLGGGKNIDVEDSGLVEGKGGGERKEGFQLTGDDPFYAAIAVAIAFFAWASNGGLTLH
ncbi:hypothetical protein HJC23_011717 [Cyclotella cryptica]|uniref:Peptidase M41 domain-containing protein n=1 Tax=Cyclotella cryptica TaxID=29204 RepID=A0ABD3QJQ6_9STRA|eukprot:CCRYP_004852-RA/>CCRYP_004852-RA protein AED:0.06 eAED:0.06 QI:0/-1/0/1/-1/1/1/0/581